MNNTYTKDLVSVIIPTYKRTNTLRRAIKSVKNQTYPYIEIIVVDDNEPGDKHSLNVKEIIEELGYSNLILITQLEHINGARARNLGILNANGEYIAFLDDDDLWFPNKIEKQILFIKNQGSDIGGVSTKKIYFKNNKLSHISEKWHVNDNQCVNIMAKNLNISTCTLLLKHNYLDIAGYFDEKLKRHQEIQLLAFFTNNFKIALLNEVLTIIDISDTGNRPNYENLKLYKKTYLESVNPIVIQYPISSQNFIILNNMTEVAWTMYRDNSKLKGLILLISCFKNYRVLISFINRFIEKYKSKVRLKNFEFKKQVLNLINMN